MTLSYSNEDIQTLLEGLPPEQPKRIAFMIGRMNPPTKAHYKVIDKMKQFIRNNPSLNLEAQPVVIVIAGEKSSEDKSKNPLTADERISFMKASGNANGVIFLSSKSAFFALGAIRDAGYEPIAIGAGSDRAEGYKKMLDKGFNHPDGSPIEHIAIPGLDRTGNAMETKKDAKKSALDKALETLHSSGDLNDEEVSGSVARRAVELGYREEFATITGLEKKPALAELMFKKLQKAFGLEDNTQE
jgi:hypothetical protein